MKTLLSIFLLLPCGGLAANGRFEAHATKKILDINNADVTPTQRKWSEPLGSEFFLSQEFSSWRMWARVAAEESEKNIFRGLDMQLSRNVGDQRWILGDLITGDGGYMHTTQLSGLSLRQEVSSQERVQQQPLAYLLSPVEIYFKQDVWVQIWSHETLLSEQFFVSGQYPLREIPILLGLQEAVLKMRNQFGVEQTLLVQLMDHAVLPQGRQVYRYDVGSPWTENNGERSYLAKGNYFSMRHQYGMTEALTVGVQYQNWLYRHFGAIEATYDSPWGIFGLVTGTSYIVDILGGVGRGFWRSHAQHDFDWVWSIDVDQRADGFFEIQPSNLAPAKFETRLDFGARKRVTEGMLVALGGYHENNFFAEPDVSVARAQVEYAFSERWKMAVFFDEQINGTRADRSGLTIAWNDFPARNSASTTSEFLGKSSETYFARTTAENSEGFAGHVLSRNLAGTGAEGGAFRYHQNGSHLFAERHEAWTRVGLGGVWKWGDREDSTDVSPERLVPVDAAQDLPPAEVPPSPSLPPVENAEPEREH